MSGDVVADQSAVLSALRAEYDLARGEYQRVAAPLLEKATALSVKITNIRRDAGGLFYVEYMRYHHPRTEECDDLAEAKEFAHDLEDAGEGVVKRIHGPGVDLNRHEWDT